ncbi:hypothetical protein JCGZ_06477 [Jatropha curcas]|uniref:Uncharacterized protein n=1 Tax=Jatropha curcas TaxID=180498 RepID=A0A067LQ62_JATCU|nr:hypothetical protein JCGZ_06477 [Jatropha curcas]
MALTAAVLPPLMAASSFLRHRWSSRRRNDRTKEASRVVPTIRVETVGNGEKSPELDGGEAVEGDSSICTTVVVAGNEEREAASLLLVCVKKKRGRKKKKRGGV